jgi:hypothetical protein
MVVGAAIANATSTVNFWTGSSSGSQKKDDALSAVAANSGSGPDKQEQSITINNPQKESAP